MKIGALGSSVEAVDGLILGTVGAVFSSDEGTEEVRADDLWLI